MKSIRARRSLVGFGLATALFMSPGYATAFVIGPTTPGKWGSPILGTGASITYSFMPDGTDCAAEFSGCSISAFDTFMPLGWESQVTAAFAAWSAVADMTFTEVADDGAAFNAPTTSGDIRFGGHPFDGPSGALAHGFFPPANGDTAAGDIHLDSSETWDLSFAGSGFSIFQVLAHEIGHALGLDHTGVPSSLMNPIYSEAFSGPQADDIAGAQYLYGAPAVPAPVPEPGALALVSLGLAAVVGLRRRAA